MKYTGAYIRRIMQIHVEYGLSETGKHNYIDPDYVKTCIVSFIYLCSVEVIYKLGGARITRRLHKEIYYQISLCVYTRHTPVFPTDKTRRFNVR